MSGDVILNKLANIVGNANIKKEAGTYVVSPGSTEDIQKIVLAANQQKFNVHIKICDDDYHGIDDIAPDDVILDFSRMNNIQNLNKKVTISNKDCYYLFL